MANYGGELCVQNTGGRVADYVHRNDRVFGVLKYTGPTNFTGFTEGRIDFLDGPR
jgi:hypothetical protein